MPTSREMLRDESGSVDKFRCPFHGATWDLEGQFQGIPNQWDFEHIEGRDMSLPQVKVATWGGFVFINFDQMRRPSKTTWKCCPITSSAFR